MTRKREKEASKALSSMPSETIRKSRTLGNMKAGTMTKKSVEFKSLSRQAYDFRNWIENQPEWIQRRHDIIQDRFT